HGGKGLLQVLLEAEEVAHLRRLRDRREQCHVAEREYGLPGWALERLGGSVHGVLAALHDGEDARGAKLDHGAPPIDKGAGLRGSIPNPKRHESHGDFDNTLGHPRRTPCASSTKTPSPTPWSRA